MKFFKMNITSSEYIPDKDILLARSAVLAFKTVSESHNDNYDYQLNLLSLLKSNLKDLLDSREVHEEIDGELHYLLENIEEPADINHFLSDVCFDAYRTEKERLQDDVCRAEEKEAVIQQRRDYERGLL